MSTTDAPQLTLEERATIEQQLVALSYAWAYHLDQGEFEALVQDFTRDGVFDRAGQVHRGQDEIREGMKARPGITTRHVVTNFHFTSVGPDEAEGVIYCMTYHAHGSFDGTAPLVYGTANGRLLELRDQYRRTEAGWRFASRVAVPVFAPEVWP